MTTIEQIKAKGAISTSDEIKFTKIQITNNIFGRNFSEKFICGRSRSSFKHLKDKTIWFPNFTSHKDWENHLSDDGIFYEKYIGEEKLEQFKKLKPEEPHRKDREKNRNIYAFAKYEDGFYRFKGVFKFIENKDLVFIYEKISDELNIGELLPSH